MLKILLFFLAYRGVAAAPICGTETLGQGFDHFFLTLHGNGHSEDFMPKKTVFYTVGTFNLSCGELPMCVKEEKSCDSDEQLFSILVKIDSAYYLSEGMSMDVEISVTTGISMWESTSTKTQAFFENIQVFNNSNGLVFLQGGYGRIWSGTCSVQQETTKLSDSLFELLTKIPQVSVEEAAALAFDVILEYGPAVAVGGSFGGAYTTTFYSTEEDYAAFMSASTSGTQGIHDSGYFWGAGGTVAGAVETADGLLWEKYHSTRYSSALGVMPPADGSSYVSAIGNNCVATRIQLAPMHSFVAERGVEGLNSSDLYLVVDLLQTAEWMYCVKLGICKITPEPTMAPTAAPALGGMYTTQDNGAGVANAVTGEFNCPTGYTAFVVGRTLAPEGKVGENTMLCLLNTTVDEGDNFTGTFQKDDITQNDSRNNPFTGALSCPSGYSAIQYGRVTTAEPHWEGANQYYCYKPVVPLGVSYFGGFYQLADLVSTIDNVHNYFD